MSDVPRPYVSAFGPKASYWILHTNILKLGPRQNEGSWPDCGYLGKDEAGYNGKTMDKWNQFAVRLTRQLVTK